MPLTPVSTLVAEAEKHITSLSVDDVKDILDDSAIQLIDIRDVRELWMLGTIPGAYHAPRGMLEFWIDPDSPYAKPIFQSDKKFVLFCGGGLRSALATKALQDMGFSNVAHIEGGFTAWTDADGPIEECARDDAGDKR